MQRLVCAFLNIQAIPTRIPRILLLLLITSNVRWFYVQGQKEGKRATNVYGTDYCMQGEWYYCKYTNFRRLFIFGYIWHRPKTPKLKRRWNFSQHLSQYHALYPTPKINRRRNVKNREVPKFCSAEILYIYSIWGWVWVYRGHVQHHCAGRYGNESILLAIWQVWLIVWKQEMCHSNRYQIVFLLDRTRNIDALPL